MAPISTCRKKKIIKMLHFWSRIFFRTKTGGGGGETYKRRKKKIEGLHSKKFVACWWVPCSVLSQQAHPVVIVHWLIIKPDALVGLPHCHSEHTTFSLFSVTHVQSAQLHYISREGENSIRFWYTILVSREKHKRKLSAFQYPIFVFERKMQEKTLYIFVTPCFCTWEKKNTRKLSTFWDPSFVLKRKTQEKTLCILVPIFCTWEKNKHDGCFWSRVQV
jgi:hypothetical protein